MVDYPTNSGAASAVTGRARPTTPAGGGSGVNRNANKQQVRDNSHYNRAVEIPCSLCPTCPISLQTSEKC